MFPPGTHPRAPADTVQPILAPYTGTKHGNDCVRVVLGNSMMGKSRERLWWRARFCEMGCRITLSLYDDKVYRSRVQIYTKVALYPIGELRRCTRWDIHIRACWSLHYDRSILEPRDLNSQHDYYTARTHTSSPKSSGCSGVTNSMTYYHSGKFLPEATGDRRRNKVASEVWINVPSR